MKVNDINAIAKTAHSDNFPTFIGIIASYERHPLYEIGVTS